MSDPKKRCDDIAQLHPHVAELAKKLIAEAKKQGLNAKVIDTYRSPERQDWLYAQGRTRPGNVVTNATGKDLTSYHNWGLAFDCIQNVPGKEYDRAFLNKLGAIGQKLGLEWGGGWSSFSDAPHFQFTFGLSIRDLKAGKKPPIVVQKKTYTVTVDEVPMCVDGKVVMVESVNIDGYTFSKIRDIACSRITIDYGNVRGHKEKMPVVTIR